MNNQTLAVISFLSLALVASDTRCAAQGNFFVFGPPEAGVNLNGNSFFSPFGTSQAGRFQQVYAASAFPSLVPAGGGWIRALSFRNDPTIGYFSQYTINAQLSFSTTAQPADGLSTTFANNIGPDEMTVLGPASMPLTGGGGGGLSSFDVNFVFLSTPFFYNPANGNLLMDFRFLSGAGIPPSGGSPLDAFNVFGDSVSSVSSLGGSSYPTIGTASSLGLATAFVFGQVPEPSSWALLLMGAACFALWHRRKLKGRRNHVPD